MSVSLLLSVAVILVALGVFALLLTGVVLIVRDTVRKSGRWGINTSPGVCTQCRTSAPVIRKPASVQQALWGGWTCEKCGFELDKWGRPVENQAFPAKWSAQLDDELPAAELVDERYKPSKDDIHRGDRRG